MHRAQTPAHYLDADSWVPFVKNDPCGECQDSKLSAAHAKSKLADSYKVAISHSGVLPHLRCQSALAFVVGTSLSSYLCRNGTHLGARPVELAAIGKTLAVGNVLALAGEVLPQLLAGTSGGAVLADDDRGGGRREFGCGRR